MIEKTDLLTGEKFIPKRINQNFIRPANRIKFYNEKANQLRHSSSNINKPLHINHRILIELLADKSEAVHHKQFLVGKGFSFGVFTHWENIDGKDRNATYNFIIIPLEKDHIKIIKK